MQVMYMPIFIASYNVCKILYSFGPPKCRGRPCRSDTHACIHACVNICILIARTQVRRLALPGQSVNFVWGLHNLQVPRTGVWSCLLSSYQCICMDSVCGIQPCHMYVHVRHVCHVEHSHIMCKTVCVCVCVCVLYLCNMCICIHTHRYRHIYIYMCVCIYIYICLYICVCVYIYTYYIYI